MKFARFVAGVALIALATPPAHAAPVEGEILAVFAADRCSAAPCATPRDPTLAGGAVVRGAVEIRFRARSDFGFEWVRLEAFQYGAWQCLQRWAPPGATELETAFRWESPAWPAVSPDWRCRDEESEHQHGEPTVNGAHPLRVIARALTGEEATSRSFDIWLENPPAAPAWQAGAVAEQHDGRTRVTLAWYTNDEPDARGFVVTRTGGGATKRTVVTMNEPEKAGCRIDTGGIVPVLACSDAGFARAGEYTYRLVAFRPGSARAQPCPDGAGRCVSSAASEPRTARAPPDPAPPPGVPEPSPDAAPPPPPPPTAIPTPAEGVAPPPPRASLLRPPAATTHLGASAPLRAGGAAGRPWMIFVATVLAGSQAAFLLRRRSLR